MKDRFYARSVDETLQDFGTSRDGLTTAEAAARLEKNGKNKLAEGKKTPMWLKFLQQLADPMIIILLVAAVVATTLEVVEAVNAGHGVTFGCFTDGIIILAVVLINATLGVVQESKAEAALEALKQMTAATTKVIRDGKQISVKSEDLVVGDIIVLEAGDAIPADARIIECASLKCEESAMTGESVPVDKTADTISCDPGESVSLGDRRNMVFMGSTAVYGRAVAVIVETGMDTEMGKIAGALADAADEKTPLQIKLAQLSRVLTYLVLGICVVIFGVSLFRVNWSVGGSDIAMDILSHAFIPAVSLAVAAIPEGLATVVTIGLSIGVTRMSKQGAVIRKLSAVETLGCTQIICSDKTGTLTQNKMTVVEHACAHDENKLATAMALCSDSKLDENNQAIGEPTENALVNYAYKLGLAKQDLEAATPRVGEIPFDSSRKLMTTVHALDGKFVQYTKGAPDVLLSRCNRYEDADGIHEMTEEKRAEILAANKALADKALRVLACGYNTFDTAPASYEADTMESNLVFLGLVGMIDPVRPEVKLAIEQCRSAGIRAVMITGDHRDTAAAIAMELGIISDPSEAITGAELDQISDEEFAEKVTQYSVYARVQPEHKTRIVKAWKALGKVTAMTGDGVNDAPSIKSADIGVGMGITGTDVTKNVADMILSDDNFATIVKAAEEGRRIYDNIRRAIRFLLSSNMAEVVAVFIASMCGFEILRPVHLLWINLITDCFPALALGLEKPEANIMSRPPRDKREGIFAGGLGVDVVYQGLMVGILTLAAYVVGVMYHLGAAGFEASFANFWDIIQGNTDAFAKGFIAETQGNGMTMAFLTMSMAEIFHAYNMRSERGSIFGVKHHNMWLFGAMAFSFIASALVIEVPFLASVFEFQSLGIWEYLIGIAIAVLVIPIVESVKIIQRAIAKRKESVSA